MARIKIKDLPKDSKVSKEEMKKVFGGLLTQPSFTSAKTRISFDPQPEPPGYGTYTFIR